MHELALLGQLKHLHLPLLDYEAADVASLAGLTRLMTLSVRGRHDRRFWSVLQPIRDRGGRIMTETDLGPEEEVEFAKTSSSPPPFRKKSLAVHAAGGFGSGAACDGVWRVASARDVARPSCYFAATGPSF
jgi:hypothetical protein